MKAEFTNNSKSDTYKVEIRKNKDNALIVDAFELCWQEHFDIDAAGSAGVRQHRLHGHDHSIPRRQADRHAEYGADAPYCLPLAKGGAVM